MTTLAEIAHQLKEPFDLSSVELRPKGKVEREGKTLCMALPYADPRVYQDRLNAVAYGEWSTPAPVVVVAGNKLICYVTVVVCGVPHTDVGEATNNEENTGTEAWSQGFKRACSQFGLGRYLYDLEKEWVPFNVQKKQIELDKAGCRAVVRKMYQKAGIMVAEQAQANGSKPVAQEGAKTSKQPSKDEQTLNECKRLALEKGIVSRSGAGWLPYLEKTFQAPTTDADLLASPVKLASLRGELLRAKAVG